MSDLLPHAAPGFDQPLELLLACHGRMEQHCELLERLVDHLETKGLDNEARSAIEKVRKYFNTAAVHHHNDEEEDLFPLLTGAEELIAELLRQHKELEQQWQRLDSLLCAADLVDRAHELKEVSDSFIKGYRQHIEIENGEVLPLAQAQLTASQLERMAATMERRRR